MINKKENRLQFHIVPPHGLLNDPNGLSYFNGKHHVFYQWNQNGTTHQNKSWGHVSSEDFIKWETHPPALEPGDWFDKDGCYSGSAVIDQEKMYLFYTGNVRNERGERESYQCLATSEDGIHFIKQGPILEQPKGYTAHVRDPKVWQDETGLWNMVLGAQTLKEKGTALLYQSNNLIDWNLVKDIGETLPSMGYMWECPDFITLEDDQVFLYCPQGSEIDRQPNENLYQSGYIIRNVLEDDTCKQQSSKFQKVDYGFEFYAPQTYQDSTNRTILYGWLGLMDPEVEKTFPSVKDGYIHALTIPRLLEVVRGKLIQKPLPELKKLRTEESLIYENRQEIDLQLPTLQNEIECHWKKIENVQIHIRKEVELSYDAVKQEITITRTNWKTQMIEKRIAQLDQPMHHLQIFMEHSSLEFFVNEGEKVFSMRYVAEESEKGFQIKQIGTRNNTITIWPLQTIDGILS
ncbi:sucrose-6-phosphate hydrolase [Jeotgalibaca sp. MA1X17-3]|uniref:glycoside hydrolase family 32 protein n=1 Tax=Jeotgalibaca sp. MA1X17-3 TaxID=2908211 RepID=UPI001F3D1072|nr:sucrose-6-phosphate hydrolase [Jeotgalibaca sp. MA1X17-3]UJF15425.1 sucrose-6-phosphate hydrolase [Jeotgalibaca sp. MA1X17-3]